jgi:hypothetical protein
MPAEPKARQPSELLAMASHSPGAVGARTRKASIRIAAITS